MHRKKCNKQNYIKMQNDRKLNTDSHMNLKWTIKLLYILVWICKESCLSFGILNYKIIQISAQIHTKINNIQFSVNLKWKMIKNEKRQVWINVVEFMINLLFNLSELN